jgi:hypothetical protein
MPTLQGLPLELDAAVRNELRTGEELWYAGMPSPGRTARKMWPIAIFGLFFGGFAAFWITMAAAGAWFGNMQSNGSTGSEVATRVVLLFPLFGLPFLLIGLAMVASPWWVARNARRTACCVTNQRAMQIQHGRSIKVRSWRPEDIHEITKTLHADGTGTLLFSQSEMRGSRGTMRTVSEGFYGVPEPRACEEALLELKASARQ